MIEDFNTVIDMPYDEFLKDLEKEDNTGERYDLLLLAQSAMQSSFEAIKISFDRVEGLQETPVEFDIPGFYTRYVNATSVEGGDAAKTLEAPKQVLDDSYDPATAKLRETLRKMRKMPRQVPDMVEKAKQIIDGGGSVGENIPTVKMIIAANLILLSRKKPKVVSFVFDQIYGKLVHKIKLLNGEDVYVDNYTEKVAPAGSVKDKDGVWVAENKQMRAIFIAGFARTGGQYAHLKDGEDGV